MKKLTLLLLLLVFTIDFSNAHKESNLVSCHEVREKVTEALFEAWLSPTEENIREAYRIFESVVKSGNKVTHKDKMASLKYISNCYKLVKKKLANGKEAYFLEFTHNDKKLDLMLSSVDIGKNELLSRIYYYADFSMGLARAVSVQSP